MVAQKMDDGIKVPTTRFYEVDAQKLELLFKKKKHFLYQLWRLNEKRKLPGKEELYTELMNILLKKEGAVAREEFITSPIRLHHRTAITPIAT